MHPLARHYRPHHQSAQTKHHPADLTPDERTALALFAGIPFRLETLPGPAHQIHLTPHQITRLPDHWQVTPKR